ncbi:response regulator transcription factor [Patescibacteria group bacterium]
MRVLIVEDDKEIRDNLKTGLSSEYFVVDTAEDGEEGSYLARTNDYDIVILDNMLPKKEGVDVCRDIRNAGLTMPILILSAVSESTTKVELLNAGADDYLTKPFSFEELIARINAISRRPQEQINLSVLKTNNLIMDTKKHLITRNGNEIHLTRKEFMLLEYLLRNKGCVMSRAMIMEHVWNIEADPFSNTIEVHIRSLRKKIDGKNKRKLIQTVSGSGYKIVG